MNLDRYSVIRDLKELKYTFFSVGPKGVIKKVVRFVQVAEDLFNLSFGDWNHSLNKNDDFARTNNDDRDKVLATVAFIVIDFLEYFPKAQVWAQGSTPARTRLYQMGINSSLDYIEKMLCVYGYADDEWQKFEKEKKYSAFKVKNKKTLKLI